MSLYRKLHSLYVRALASAIWTHEALFFYPRLRRFYHWQTWQANAPKLILDIGANRGQSVRFFSKCFPLATIHSFEPNGKLFAKLQTLCTRMIQPVYVHRLGVSNATGHRIFYEHVLDETSGFEQPDPSSAYARKKSRTLLMKPEETITGSYEVETVTLDDFSKKHQMPAVDILKVDVEGHEYAVLEGAKGLLAKGVIRFVQLEEHQGGLYTNRHQAIANLLQGYGYREIFRLGHIGGSIAEVIYEKQST
jgi:FkbM family methyltransferase